MRIPADKEVKNHSIKSGVFITCSISEQDVQLAICCSYRTRYTILEPVTLVMYIRFSSANRASVCRVRLRKIGSKEVAYRSCTPCHIAAWTFHYCTRDIFWFGLHGSVLWEVLVKAYRSAEGISLPEMKFCTRPSNAPSTAANICTQYCSQYCG